MASTVLNSPPPSPIRSGLQLSESLTPAGNPEEIEIQTQDGRRVASVSNKTESFLPPENDSDNKTQNKSISVRLCSLASGLKKAPKYLILPLAGLALTASLTITCDSIKGEKWCHENNTAFISFTILGGIAEGLLLFCLRNKDSSADKTKEPGDLPQSNDTTDNLAGGYSDENNQDPNILQNISTECSESLTDSTGKASPPPLFGSEEADRKGLQPLSDCHFKSENLKSFVSIPHIDNPSPSPSRTTLNEPQPQLNASTATIHSTDYAGKSILVTTEKHTPAKKVTFLQP